MISPEQMPTEIHADLLTLHGLAVRKSGVYAAILGVEEAGVASALGAAVEAGLAAGAEGMFMVSPAGRDWLDGRYPEAFADFRADPAATEAYERFERINLGLLALFTDWQMMSAAGGERVANDHSDADYDAEIVDRLSAQHERAEKVLDLLDRFTPLDPRLEVYKGRLDEAYDKVLAGDLDYVSAVRIDSFLTI